MWMVPDHIDINEKMIALGNYYETETTILIHSKFDEDELEWKPDVYKNDWRVMKSLINRKRDIIIFFGNNDYIRFNKEKTATRVGNNMSKFVENIMVKKENPIHRDIKEMGYDHKPYLTLYKNKKFVGMIDAIFNNMDISTDIVKTVMYPKPVDIYMFKVLNVLWLIKTQDKIYIKEFRGNPNDRSKGIDPEFEVRTFLDTLKRFTDININIEDIYIEVEENYFDDQYIDFVYKENNIETPEEAYENARK